jgi:hypothetical protein
LHDRCGSTRRSSRWMRRAPSRGGDGGDHRRRPPCRPM